MERGFYSGGEQKASTSNTNLVEETAYCGKHLLGGPQKAASMLACVRFHNSHIRPANVCHNRLNTSYRPNNRVLSYKRI